VYPEIDMSRLEAIEGEVRQLSADELKRFRDWFYQFDADAWDRQIEADVHAGKLDKLIEKAVRDDDAGRTTEL
jgi:hypothetical protein